VRALVASFLLAACAPASPSPGAVGDPLFFPVHDVPLGLGADAGLVGTMAGTLDFRDGCLVIDSEDEATFLAIWPMGTKPGVIANRPVVLTQDDVLLAEPGDRLIFSGAEILPERAGEHFQGQSAPCAADRVWLVGDVEPGR
jgi:hypothetical protein